MKKFLLWGYFLFSGIPLAWGGLFITHTPAFEGVVIDSDTGKPIANAIISVQWYKAVLDFHGGVREIGEPQLVVTDENGKYRIIGKYWWAVLGVEGCRLRILHPLYEGKHEDPIYGKNFREFREKYKDGEHIRYQTALNPRPKEWIGYEIAGKIDPLLASIVKGKDNQAYVYQDDFKYFQAAKQLRFNFKSSVPNWENYSHRKGTKAILEQVGLDEK